jgi:hypothetical protein
MNVKFILVKLKASFLALAEKDQHALYWIAETSELFKGDQLFGTGAMASENAAGLMSPEDYAALKALIAAGESDRGILNLKSVDGTISITGESDTKFIDVAIAPLETNALVAVDGGLFVPTVVVPEYSIEKQDIAEDGFAASYKLKKTVGDDVSYVGDTINIARDMVLKSATLETVIEDGVPYADAKVGDPYIKMVFNDIAASNIYIPVNGLVDKFEAGIGISIENNVISVRLADESHGLVAVDGALSLALATKVNDGAMSKEDKEFLDSLKGLNIPNEYATKAELQLVQESVSQIELSYSWGEL